MEIKQIIVTVRGTKGEAKQVTIDAGGSAIAGDASLLPLVQGVLGGGSAGGAASAPGGSAVEPNEVADAQPSMNEVIDAQPSMNEV